MSDRVVLKVQTVVGVPVKEICVPTMAALKPGGRLDCATRVSAPVPPLTGMEPR